MVNKELNLICQGGNTNKDTEDASLNPGDKSVRVGQEARMETEGSAHTWAPHEGSPPDLSIYNSNQQRGRRRLR